MDNLNSKLAAYLFVALGGAVGAAARFWVKEITPQITSAHFPLSTLMVNVVGCFFAGLVYVYLEQSNTQWFIGKYLFFFVGLLGAFTTFSAFALDSLILFNQGENYRFLLNILANCLLCLICVFFGAWVGGRIAAN